MSLAVKLRTMRSSATGLISSSSGDIIGQTAIMV